MAQVEGHERIGFRKQKNEDEKIVDRTCVTGRGHAFDRLLNTEVGVARGGDGGKRHHRNRDHLAAGNPVQHNDEGQRCQSNESLFLPGERDDHHETRYNKGDEDLAPGPEPPQEAAFLHDCVFLCQDKHLKHVERREQASEKHN